MAIRMQVGKDQKDSPNVVAIYDFTGHEANRVCHDSNCPVKNDSKFALAFSEDCLDGCRSVGPLYLETTYVGRVLSTGEHNWYDDSDFFAIVWDDNTNAPIEIEYASTRGWSYANGATIDATPDVVEKYKAYIAEQKRTADLAVSEKEAKTVRIHKRVRIIGGRKHKGKEGIVVWQGVNQFRTYYRNGYNRPEQDHNQRIQVLCEDGEKFFTEYTYAEVI